MKDIKKHIDDHRREYDDFYDEELSDLWDGIAEKLDAKTKKTGFQVWKVAAIVLAFLISGFIAYKTGQMNSRLPEELVEVETHYSPLIAHKTSLIMAHAEKIDAMIWADMEEIDKACIALKKDLKDKVDNEEVISSIIRNYRIKLSILDQLLEEIERKKNEDTNDKTTGI